MNIKLYFITNLSEFNTIYMRKESVEYKYKCTFNSWIIFNGKNEFGGPWGDYRY